MNKFLIAICLLLSMSSLAWGQAGNTAGNAGQAGSEAGSEAVLDEPSGQLSSQPAFSIIQYQALGRSFVLPMVPEVGLAPMPPGEPNNPAWRLLATAWNQARILPYQVMGSWDMGEVNMYLAVMGNQVNGGLLAAPVEQVADFISAQKWAEYNEDLDLAALAPDKMAGLGVFARDDNSIYAISVQRGQADLPQLAPQPEEQADQTGQNQELLSSLMISSISVVNGVPVILGVGTNAPQRISADQLFSICRNLTLYLALANRLPDSGFFNPDMDNLVIAGRKLQLALPKGSCLLRASSPRQAVTLIQWERFYYDTHNLVAAYAPCDKLQTWLEGPADGQLSHYGLLATNLYNGQFQVVDDPKAFIRNLSQEQKGQALVAAKLDEIDWTQTLKEMPVGDMEVPGHMGMQRNVAYWVALLRVPSSQSSGVLAGLLGVGVVKGLAVTNVLYMPIEEDQVFQQLLEQQKAMFAGFK